METIYHSDLKEIKRRKSKNFKQLLSNIYSAFSEYSINRWELFQAMINTNRLIYKHNSNQYKTILRIFDILMVFVILFNYGAYFMTNALVVRTYEEQGIDIEFVELNPKASEMHDFKPSEDKVKWNSVVILLFTYFIIISIYLTCRLRIGSWRDFIVVGIMSVSMFIIAGFDFFNDLGFFVGKML